MTKLPYTFWCWHLTETGDLKWRQGDWDARSIVKGLKQEPFKGRLEITINKVPRIFTSANIEDLMNILLPMLGQKLRDDISGKISIVPIPNSGMAVGQTGPFRAIQLAEMIVKGYGSDATVVPAVLWNKPRENKSHQTKGFRSPDQFEPLMRLADRPKNSVVLFDDVLTSGSQMIAAGRFLTKQGFPPARGLVVAHATKLQQKNPFLYKHEDELELSPKIFNLDKL